MHFQTAITLLLAITCTACASTHPNRQAEDVLNSYSTACRKGQEETASAYLLAPGKHINVCPEEPIQSAQSMDLTARQGMTQFSQSTKQSGIWHIHPGNALVPNSLHQLLSDIKYAIKTQDAQKLYSLTIPASSHTLEDIAEWITGSRANAIYASLASTTNSWFQLEGKTALFDASGIILTFENHEGQWLLSATELLKP